MSRLSEAERLIQANNSALEKLDNHDLESLDHVVAAMSLDTQAEILRLLAVIADRMEGEEG